MSKETYAAGFCKAAAAKNVDPRELALYIASVKQAQAADAGAAAATDASTWAKVLAWLKDMGAKAKGGINDARAWTNENLGPSTQSLAGGLLGAGIGTGLGAAIKGKKGLAPGAIIGALSGAAAPQVDWQAVINSFRPPKNVKKDNA